MPTPEIWTLLSYVTEAGVDVVEQWDVPETFEAAASFNAVLKNIRSVSDHTQWTAWRHPMKGEAGKHGVVELGFKADKKQYRILCKFNGKKCIVLLCVCYHKESNWTPREAVKLATQRAKAIESGKAKTNVIKIEDDI